MDDKLVNGIDAQNTLDDTESLIDKLIKRKRKWTGIATFWFIIWLLIIMYMFWTGFFHQDTIKPPQPTPVTTDEPTPEPEPTPEAESIEVYEYNLRSVGLSIPFEGSLLVQDSVPVYDSDRDTFWDSSLEDKYVGSVGGAYYVNDSAITDYDNNYSVLWEIAKGDDCFTAEKNDSVEGFTTNVKEVFDVTGTSDLGNIYANAVEGYENVRPLICITESNVRKGVDGIAVILPSDVSEEEISQGVSTFLEKVNALNLKLGISEAGSYWNIDDKSIEDFKNLLGESFSTTGYTISSTGNEDISILGYVDGGLIVKSSELKSGNKVVFITLEIFTLMDDMHGHSSAAYYSKYLQGDESIELYNDLDAFHKVLGNEYNN